MAGWVAADGSFVGGYPPLAIRSFRPDPHDIL